MKEYSAAARVTSVEIELQSPSSTSRFWPATAVYSPLPRGKTKRDEVQLIDEYHSHQGVQNAMVAEVLTRDGNGKGRSAIFYTWEHSPTYTLQQRHP